MRRWGRTLLAILCAVSAAATAVGCARGASETETLSAQAGDGQSGDGMKLVFWHYYNDAQKKHLDQLIEEYNSTEGADRNVTVEAYSQGSIDDLTNKLDLVLNESSNDLEMADMFLAYRDMVVNVVKEHSDKLVDFSTRLSAEELQLYNQDYLNEGYISGKLYTLPVVKSTELLLMNEPRLDEFLAARPQYQAKDMGSWSGLEEMARGYFEWTDAMTPDVDGDGKPFIGLDNLPNYFIAMNHAQGSDIYHYGEDGQLVLELDRDYIKRLFLNYYKPFTKGYYGASGRYRSDDVKQSFLAGYIGASSSVLYFPDEVADEEGNMIPIEIGIYKYPVLDGAQPTAVQQGAGVAIFNSESDREDACIDFIRWLTLDKGFEMASSMSYMPVNNAQLTAEQESGIDNDKVLQGMKVGLEQSRSYKMVYGFDFENSYDARAGIDQYMSSVLKEGRDEFAGYLDQGLSMEEAENAMDYEKKADAFYEQITTIFGQ